MRSCLLQHRYSTSVDLTMEYVRISVERKSVALAYMGPGAHVIKYHVITQAITTLNLKKKKESLLFKLFIILCKTCTLQLDEDT